MKKIILVCHHFVPYSPAVGGVARMWYLANYLTNHGHEVTVVASNGVDFGSLGFPNLPNTVKTIYINDPIKKAMQQQISALKTSKKANFLRSKIVKAIRKVADLFAFPDYAIFALHNYYKQLKALLNQDKYSAVIVSAPSHSLLLLIVLLKRSALQGVKFIADYRDGWNATALFAKNGFLRAPLSRYLESKALTAADYILFATNPMRTNTQKLFSTVDLFSKSLVVMNGYPEALAKSAKRLEQGKPSTCFRLGYFGVANDQAGSYRNIWPIILALDVLRCEGLEFSLELYGDIRISQLDLSDYDFVRVMGSLSHSESISRMFEMDCLLMYHMERKGASEVITGKFFDYVCSQRPILCVSPLDMEGALMVKSGGFGKVADFESQDQIWQAFREIFNGEVSIDPEKSIEFSRERQFDKIFKLI